LRGPTSKGGEGREKCRGERGGTERGEEWREEGEGKEERGRERRPFW